MHERSKDKKVNEAYMSSGAKKWARGFKGKEGNEWAIR